MRKLRGIYLDYAASTPVDASIMKAMRPYFAKTFGNPSSLHRAGAAALAALDKARERVAEATGVGFRDVVFTASATEANNLALRGVVRAFTFVDQNSFSPAEKLSFPSARRAASRGDQAGAPAGYPREANARTVPKIIVSSIEHDSVLETARDMERAGEAELAVLPVDKRGVVDLAKLEKVLDEHTVLVSVMYVNNEIGTLQPISKIAEIVSTYRSNKTDKSDRSYPLLHTDAAQAFLYYPCNMHALGVDLITLSSQKIYGPKGAGALCVRRQIANSKAQSVKKNEPFASGSLPLAPLLTGGAQEFGIRAGTENVPTIVGFAAAAALAEKERGRNAELTRKARDTFVHELKKALPDVEENGPQGQSAAPHIANLAFPRGVSSEDLLVMLDREGIAASPGAACSARALTLSHVLQAIGVSEERIRRSIRFSFGRGVTEKEARDAAHMVAKAARYVLGGKSLL